MQVLERREARAGDAADAGHDIRQLLADYAHALDDDRLEAWPDFFTEDGCYRLTTRENVAAGLPVGIILCHGRGMLRDRIAALRTANIYEPHWYTHVLGPASIDAEEGGWRVRSNFSVYRTFESGESMLYGAGRYLDRVSRTASGMRLRERTVVLDSRCIDVLTVIPV
ncbi:Anthranilate 1,2-dioxygenase small subunit [Pigmentiphaga humi]|uniref:Anthranilate 1,2-dioxygenase small subunit n=1 Tax=Pigmentiphaga humi TaxID=2478468 RepID=A0A3P4B3H5_9BURK|nr:aromatic-ring-hydroxylating dioxygenase subunit beta [Pigmentiphaga humi]VCU70086.1 Anthranilate 1,2-dioxygenase small subunit [Pigmentiphaga humi]